MGAITTEAGTAGAESGVAGACVSVWSLQAASIIIIVVVRTARFRVFIV
jgi:hypothetical protein